MGSRNLEQSLNHLESVCYEGRDPQVKNEEGECVWKKVRVDLPKFKFLVVSW